MLNCYEVKMTGCKLLACGKSLVMVAVASSRRPAIRAISDQLEGADMMPKGVAVAALASAGSGSETVHVVYVCLEKRGW